MEILLDKRALKHIRESAKAAADEGDNESLREDILSSFTDDHIEEIERRIDTDFYDFIGEILEEWSGEDVDELIELLESHMSDADIELKFEGMRYEDDDDEEDPAPVVEEDDDLDLDDDDDTEEEEEEEEP